MMLFWLLLGFCLSVGGLAWWWSGVDALLLILLHPLVWALIIIGVAGVIRIEESRDGPR